MTLNSATEVTMTAQIHYKAGPGSAPNNLDVPKRDIGGGMVVENSGSGEDKNGVPYNLTDGSLIPPPYHPPEHFYCVYRRGFAPLTDEVGEYQRLEADAH